MRLSRGFPIWLPLMILLLSACTSKQEGVPQSEKPTAPSVPSTPTPAPAPEPPSTPTQEQTSATTEDFPLPIMEGLKVSLTMSTTRDNRAGKQLALTGKVDPVRISEFYEAEFRKRGLTIRKTPGDAAHGGEILLLGTSDTVTTGLLVTRDAESGETRAVLSWSEGK